MQTVAVANHKGGSGKTTTAVNLAACLAEMQYQVLLIDLDPQSHASLSFGIEIEKTEKSIFWAMQQPHGERALLAEIAMPVAKGLSLVPSAPLPISQEESMMTRPNRLLRLRELVAQVPKYDFVVIDCPPALGILTCNAFMASQTVLLPVETSFYAMHGVGRAIEVLDGLYSSYAHKTQHLAVATLFDKRTALARDILEELRRFFRGNLLETIIRQSVHLREAASHGQPVTAYAPSSRGCHDYCELAEEFLQRACGIDVEEYVPCAEEVILLGQIYGTSRETLAKMRAAGITTLEQLQQLDAKKLSQAAGVNVHTARQILRHAAKMQPFPVEEPDLTPEPLDDFGDLSQFTSQLNTAHAVSAAMAVTQSHAMPTTAMAAEGVVIPLATTSMPHQAPEYSQ